MKYLISLYFDDNTNKQIYGYMEKVAAVTGNDYMLANHVPPHITVSSFEVHGNVENDFIKQLQDMISMALQDIAVGDVQWVGSGAFMNSVLYMTPVLNAYLQDVMERIYDAVADCPNVEVSKFYRPFQWLPHTTIGKKLAPEELNKGFAAVQGDFHILQGKIIRIGLAKASPYEEIAEWKLQ